MTPLIDTLERAPTILWPTGTPRRIDVDSTRILCRYVEDQISMNFHVISTYFFDVISMVENFTWFPCTFCDVISSVENSTLFPRTFFNVISTVEKSTLFPRTFFDVISMVVVSTYFYRCNFDGWNMHIAFFRRNFDRQRFDIIFGKVFPVFVTLNS